MSGNPGCTVYVGNLDERVSDRVLYDILIQAGRLVDLYIPKDKETEKPKGYAFAEYETEEIAEYAVKLFSGLVTLYNRTLKFAISGQDKPSQNVPNGLMPASNLSNLGRPHYVPINYTENSHHSTQSSVPCRSSAYPSNYSQVLPGSSHHPNGHGPHVSHFNGINYDNVRRVGSSFDSISRSRSRRYDTNNPIPYSSY